MALVNYHQYLRSSLKNGGKHSIIHLKNLSADARVGVDVWGRTEDGKVNKFQPVQISASIALKAPFATAASSDSVDASTVHYGILSKEILKVLALRPAVPVRPEEFAPKDLLGREVMRFCEQDWTLAVLLDSINSWLTNFLICRTDFQPDDWKYPDLLRNVNKRTIVENDAIQELELSCFLPKGSILGSGVSLRVLTMPYGTPQADEPWHLKHRFCSILKLHDIRIPTLIGVNPNERLAKQMVIANVEIDGYFLYNVDLYHKLEQIIVKTIEESSFETLETLGTHLVQRIIKWFIYSEYDSFIYFGDKLRWVRDEPNDVPMGNAESGDESEIARQWDQVVTVSLEKPSAVMFADAPVIEVRRDADPNVDATATSKQLLDQMRGLVRRTSEHLTKVPFPLQGRLDDWIRATDPHDTT